MKVRILKCSILEMCDWFHRGENLKELEKVLKDAVRVSLYGFIKRHG